MTPYEFDIVTVHLVSAAFLLLLIVIFCTDEPDIFGPILALAVYPLVHEMPLRKYPVSGVITIVELVPYAICPIDGLVNVA